MNIPAKMMIFWKLLFLPCLFLIVFLGAACLDSDQDGVAESMNGQTAADLVLDQNALKQSDAQSGNNGAPNLLPENSNDYPTRLTFGHRAYLYVTDAKINSVFLYNSRLQVVAELKDLDVPLGLATDNQGNIYVGNDGRNNVEKYDPKGNKLLAIENIQKPTDLLIDTRNRELYIVDSESANVQVYSLTGTYRRTIGAPGLGDGQFLYPIDIAISDNPSHGFINSELFVADQGSGLIQVFDLNGNFIRSYGGRIPAFSSDWQGRFARLQSLAVDRNGKIHAADTYLNKIQILDALTGEFIDSYGSFGNETGQLYLPLDIAIHPNGDVVVANAENHRVEIIYRAR